MRKTNAANSPITCTIGETAVIDGGFTSKEATRIDGTINGDVSVESMLTIGQSGVVNGNIKAASLITSGKTTGNVTVDGNIEILGTASIKGDIVCSAMVMDENAFFEGNCKMNRTEQQ